MNNQEQQVYDKFLAECEELRQKCNKLTDEEREELSKEFFKIFYDEDNKKM